MGVSIDWHASAERCILLKRAVDDGELWHLRLTNSMMRGCRTTVVQMQPENDEQAGGHFFHIPTTCKHREGVPGTVEGAGPGSLRVTFLKRQPALTSNMLAGARSLGTVTSRPRCNCASVLPQASFPELLQPLCQPHVPSKTPPAFCATISKLQPTVADGRTSASEHARISEHSTTWRRAL